MERGASAMEVLGADSGGRDDKATATLSTSTLNLVNTMLGTGLLGLPAAFAACGGTLGICVLIASALASEFSLRLLGTCALGRPGCTFRELCEQSLPRGLHSLADLAITVMCVGGGCAAKLIVIGDSLPLATSYIAPTLSEDSIFLARQFWILALASGILPLVLQPSLHALRHVGFLSLACVFYIAALVCFYAVYAPDSSPSTASLDKSTTRIFCALPVFIYGFTCHQNMIQLVQELRPDLRTKARLSQVIRGAICGCGILYAGIAVAGYIAFGPGVASNMTKSLPNSLPAAIGRVMLSIALAFNFALWAHPVRASLCQIFLNTSISSADVKYWNHFVPLSLLAWALPLLLALVLEDLGIALAIVGGTGCTIMSYILPGAYFCRMPLASRDGDMTCADQKRPQRSLTWWLAAILTTLGVALVPLSIAATVMN